MRGAIAEPSPGAAVKRFAAELFAGSARLSKALASAGICTLVYELHDGPGADLSKLPVQNSINDSVGTSFLKFVWAGITCTTFSRGGRGTHEVGCGPGPLRSSSMPWGLDGLREDEQHKVDMGNVMVRFLLRLLRACSKYGCGFVAENPRTSILWCLPEVLNVAARCKAVRVEVDYCRFGEAWRKATTLLTNVANLVNITAKCKGHHGLCGVTKAPRLILAGRDPTVVLLNKTC